MKKFTATSITLAFTLSTGICHAQSKPYLAEGIETPPQVSCVDKRGEVNYRIKDTRRRGEVTDKDWVVDSVLWCPPDHPRIVHCDSIDDFAPAKGPTPFTSVCREDGPCDAAENYDRSRRENNGDQSREGPQNREHEFIVKELGSEKVEGCWGYDRGGKHRPVRLEILCCRFPEMQ